MGKFVFWLALLALLITSCTAQNTISITDAWARPGKTGENSAVYFNIENSTGADDQVIGVESDAAQTVQLHKSSMDSSGMMRMQHQDRVSVPASATIEFAPGGLHVMLIGLSADLQVGDTIELTLIFQNSGRMNVEAEVREP